MEMETATNWKQNGYTISIDKQFLQEEVIYNYLHHESYWAKGVPLEVVRTSIIHSAYCFGVYKGEPGAPGCQQVGFARVISDRATFAYLCDVFIVPSESGKGLGKWLMEVISEYPVMTRVRRFMLATRDAHGLYAKYGFGSLEEPEKFMATKRRPNV